MEQKSLFARWRANFLTGLIIVLPAVVSIIVLVWVFGSVANVTDHLLIFIPQDITHKNGGAGPMAARSGICKIPQHPTTTWQPA